MTLKKKSKIFEPKTEFMEKLPKNLRTFWNFTNLFKKISCLWFRTKILEIFALKVQFLTIIEIMMCISYWLFWKNGTIFEEITTTKITSENRNQQKIPFGNFRKCSRKRQSLHIQKLSFRKNYLKIPKVLGYRSRRTDSK